MTIISHNLTGKIDEKIVALLSEIDVIARNLKLAFFIVGATARDILLEHAHGIHTTRATLDVDIGVFVSDWEQFRTLKGIWGRPLKGVSSEETPLPSKKHHFFALHLSC